MTRKLAIGMALALTVLGGTAVYAGMGCNGGAGMFGDNPDIEKVRAFQKESSSDRDDMMIKRLELQQELAKKSPDKAKVEALRKEMIDIKARIQGSAKNAGLTGCLTECSMDPVDCAKKGECNSCDSCSKNKKKQAKKKAGCSSCSTKK